MKTVMITISALFAAAAMNSAAHTSIPVTPSLPPDAPVLAITYVQKPWYAWRSLVVGKMAESVPEYENIKGLQKKFYSFTHDYEQFGGIYLWHSMQDAQHWFNETWFEHTTEKYGKRGIVDYYQVVSVWQNSSLTTGKQNLWGTLIQTEEELKPTENQHQLLIRLKDHKNNSFILVIWKSQEAAEKFGQKYKTTYFDVPLAIVKP